MQAYWQGALVRISLHHGIQDPPVRANGRRHLRHSRRHETTAELSLRSLRGGVAVIVSAPACFRTRSSVGGPGGRCEEKEPRDSGAHSKGRRVSHRARLFQLVTLSRRAGRGTRSVPSGSSEVASSESPAVTRPALTLSRARASRSCLACCAAVGLTRAGLSSSRLVLIPVDGRAWVLLAALELLRINPSATKLVTGVTDRSVNHR